MTIGGRARRTVASGAVLACLLAATSSRADEQEHGGGVAAADGSHLDPQTAALARRLWGDLVCLCGRCQRLALSACHCPDAARERQKVVDLLRGRDLASPAGPEVAYQAVVKEYVTRFGGNHVLASERHAGVPEDLSALAVSVAIVAAACVAVAVLERRRRSRRRSGSRVRR